MKAAILQVHDPDQQFVVEVEVSESIIRAVGDQKLYLCAIVPLFCHRLSLAERNYKIGNCELLAVKLALEE